MNKNKKTFKHIAALCKKYRAQKNMTQAQLSRAMGWIKSGQYASNLERGLCGLPPKIWVQFCRETGCPSEELRQALSLDLNEQFEAIFSHEAGR